MVESGSYSSFTPHTWGRGVEMGGAGGGEGRLQGKIDDGLHRKHNKDQGIVLSCDVVWHLENHSVLLR